MATSSKPHRTRDILLLATISLILLGMVIAYLFVAKGPSLFSSPTEERPRAADEYQRHFDPASWKVVPDLKADPTPEITEVLPGDLRADEIGFRINAPDIEIDDYYERFAANKKGEVLLPDGNQLRLAGVAVLLPSDVEWGDKRYKRALVTWLDPLSGEPLPPEVTKDWEQKKQVPRCSPSLFLHVERTGGPDVDWQWTEVFDAATKARVSNSSSHSPPGQDGEFGNNLGIWHSTPLTLGVQFAFGPTESQPLLLQAGELAHFGDAAELRVLAIVPGGINSWGYSSGSNRKFTFGTDAGDPNRDGIVFSLWPRQNGPLFRFKADSPANSWSQTLSSAHRGVAHMTVTGSPKQGTLTRYSRLGRAIFELPSIPRLPEVDNLFETPIPLAIFDSGWELSSLLNRTTETTGSLRADPPSEVTFPLTRVDTTPAELLEEYETWLGKSVYYSRDAHELRDDRPTEHPFILWWKKVRPSWLPAP